MRDNGLIEELADQPEIHQSPLIGMTPVERFKDVPQDFWRKLHGEMIRDALLITNM